MVATTAGRFLLATLPASIFPISAPLPAVDVGLEKDDLISVDLRRVAGPPVGVLPLAGAQAALDEDALTFAQVLVDDLGQVAPRGAAVPLRVIAVVLVRGDGEVADSFAAAGVSELGILSEMADDLCLVERSRHWFGAVLKDSGESVRFRFWFSFRLFRPSVPFKADPTGIERK